MIEGIFFYFRYHAFYVYMILFLVISRGRNDHCVVTHFGNWLIIFDHVTLKLCWILLIEKLEIECNWILLHFIYSFIHILLFSYWDDYFLWMMFHERKIKMFLISFSCSSLDLRSQLWKFNSPYESISSSFSKANSFFADYSSIIYLRHNLRLLQYSWY